MCEKVPVILSVQEIWIESLETHQLKSGSLTRDWQFSFLRVYHALHLLQLTYYMKKHVLSVALGSPALRVRS